MMVPVHTAIRKKGTGERSMGEMPPVSLPKKSRSLDICLEIDSDFEGGS